MKLFDRCIQYVNSTQMKFQFPVKSFFALLLVTLAIACGKKSGSDPLAQLEALKDQRAKLESEISKLEKDLEAQGLIAKRLRTFAITEM